MGDAERNAMEPLLTADEVAPLLGLHVQTVYAKAKAGEIPSVKVGSRRRFRPADIRALMTPPAAAAKTA